jgi:hypothetical protein
MNPNLAFTKKGFNKIKGYRPDIRFLDDYDIGIRATKELSTHYNSKNVVIFSGRRYRTVMDILFDLKKQLKGMLEYHLTNNTNAIHVPVSGYQ